jgi:nucleotide-binding universal stress UspA family protein
MNVVIGYDGSSYADAAIDDLQWAGLPPDAQAIVLTAVQWPLQAPRSWGMVETGFPQELTEHVKEAEQLAERGRYRLQNLFRSWKIHSAAAPAGHAADGILEKAKAWPANLIVVGTHGRSALRRVVLGSVSHKLVNEAPCSVRVVRALQNDGRIRLLIGADGSAQADEAVGEVCNRSWPASTEVRVLAVHEFLVPADPTNLSMDPVLYGKINEGEHFRLNDTVGKAVEKLRAAKLTASSSVAEGDPKTVLCREARNWNASSIFVGASGLHGVERFLLGSVAAATVGHAPCTVEIVRH